MAQKRIVEALTRKCCCRTTEHRLKKKVMLSESKMPSHEENFLSRWLREDGKTSKKEN